MKSIFYTITFSLLPLLVFAQTAPEITDFKSLINFVLFYLNLLMPLVFGLMFLTFVWGLVIFIKDSDSGEAVKKGKKFMVVSVAVFFVALSFRALYTFVARDIFGTDGTTTGIAPLINRERLDEVLPEGSGNAEPDN